jgi:hypothetical protein
MFISSSLWYSTLSEIELSQSRGGDAAAGLASIRRRACLSPPQVPSLLPVRNHGSTSTKVNSVLSSMDCQILET